MACETGQDSGRLEGSSRHRNGAGKGQVEGQPLWERQDRACRSHILGSR